MLYGKGLIPYGKELKTYGMRFIPYGKELKTYGKGLIPYGKRLKTYGKSLIPYLFDTKVWISAGIMRDEQALTLVFALI